MIVRHDTDGHDVAERRSVREVSSLSRIIATTVGFAAVLLWSLLALFTAASGRVPPFQLAAMCFLIGGVLGLVSFVWRPGAWRRLTQPWPAWALGVGGLFGYHFLYFTALRNAPPVEAGLIAYLWPLLIILFSALLPGERLRAHHFLGGVAGLLGAALIVAGGRGIEITGDHSLGYAAALACALTWSGYSVLSRRLKAVPSDAVAGFCLVTAVMSLACHLVLETTVWPHGAGEWLAVAGLGLGPVGAAFYVWDHGVKHGDIQVLGASAYLAPLLSTAILIATGFAQFTWTIAVACLLITGGAAFAARDLYRARRHSPD